MQADCMTRHSSGTSLSDLPAWCAVTDCAVLCCQVEFEGIKHHMSLDRDVITSLELLAPSRYLSCTAPTGKRFHACVHAKQ